jgi:hypothetical protein
MPNWQYLICLQINELVGFSKNDMPNWQAPGISTGQLID